MKPPIIPHQGRGIDTVNFRNVKESESVDISGSRPMKGSGSPGVGGSGGGAGGSSSSAGGTSVPLDSGLATPGGETPDPFEEFNSVTLHHDGEEWNGGKG